MAEPTCVRKTELTTVRKNGTLIFHLKLSLHPQRDQAIIDWLERLPKGHAASAIRERLRGGVPLTTEAAETTEPVELHLDLGDMSFEF